MLSILTSPTAASTGMLEFLFLRTRLEKPSDEPPTDREHRPGDRADQAHRSRGAPSATAGLSLVSLFGSVVCFYNSSNIRSTEYFLVTAVVICTVV